MCRPCIPSAPGKKQAHCQLANSGWNAVNLCYFLPWKEMFAHPHHGKIHNKMRSKISLYVRWTCLWNLENVDSQLSHPIQFSHVNVIIWFQPWSPIKLS